jgi:hypothetical protein
VISGLLLAPLILAAQLRPHDEPDIPDFAAATERFADAAGCRAHMAGVVAAARTSGFDAAVGPYDFAAGDVRAHIVRAEGSGHRIEEYRCLAERLGTRSWTHSMAESEDAFTVKSAARRLFEDGWGEQ